MKSVFTFLWFLFPIFVFSQDRVCRTDILDVVETELENKNSIDNYLKFDFSNIWTEKNDDDIVYGIIGEEHQRIQIKFLTIEKNINNPKEYFVYGKSMVKSNICDFVGKITISKIQNFKGDNFGVDEEYKGKGIKNQALLTATYEFFENKNTKHSGYFSGTLQTLFYIDKNDKVKYNDINSFADGYFNNAFVGKWKMYNSKLEKICNWGDYRVPNSNCDFDIGAGEFSVSEKYNPTDWLDLIIEPKLGEKKWWK